MSAIGESDWIAACLLSLVAHVIIRMQIDACRYDCSGGDLAAVWHDGVSSVLTLGFKRAKWEIEHRRDTALRRTSTRERAATSVASGRGRAFRRALRTLAPWRGTHLSSMSRLASVCKLHYESYGRRVLGPILGGCLVAQGSCCGKSIAPVFLRLPPCRSASVVGSAVCASQMIRIASVTPLHGLSDSPGLRVRAPSARVS